MAEVAALYVETDGVYFGLPDVMPWDAALDARNYDGRLPVVSHPPCQRWGRYWSGGPSARVRQRLGDDGGCFAHALWAVRTFGGVLEHPEASHAWKWYGLNRPPKSGGWIPADDYGGVTCCVEQGHYGHRARKPTWLYAVGLAGMALRGGGVGDLIWGCAKTDGAVERLSKRERAATPIEFRDILIRIAKECRL